MAAALASAIASGIYRVPVQVSDSLEPISMAVAATSTRDLAVYMSTTGASATLRPLRYVQARWLVQAADALGVSYSALFRGAHAALIVALLAAFVAVLPIRGWVDAAAAGLALLVLVGLHTFAGMTLEAYPVNHFAQIALGSLVVYALARRAPGWFTDICAVLLLAYCLLLIESGVLIWGVTIACAVAGLPGITRRTLVVLTVTVLAYGAVRITLGIEAPLVGAHASGYGAAFYTADELRDRFGDRPLPFMGYNVVAAALSVAFSEPRSGVYRLAAAAGGQPLNPATILNMVASMLVTGIIVPRLTGIVRRRRRDWNDEDRTLVVAVLVGAATAALCVAYLKDEIISTAGVFYALAAFAAGRSLLLWATAPRRGLAAVAALTMLLSAIGPLWAFRAAALQFHLRQTAYTTRNDWVWVVNPANRSDWPADPRQLEISKRLRHEALSRRTTSPHFMPRWVERYWDE